jgi:hypothetical protein
MSTSCSGPRPWIEVRGVYGWSPPSLQETKRLAGHGLNAVFMSSQTVTPQVTEELHGLGVRVFAELNTMHEAAYVKEHPEAAPVAPDGTPSPPPHDWQGVCPTHPEYRRLKMERLRALLTDQPVDGVWLDYHHSHASWERADPVLPDTCFCDRCVAQFSRDMSIALPAAPRAEQSALLLGKHREAWVSWRCGVFTDWVREIHEIIRRTRPEALLGTFHCPWTEAEHDGALRGKLAIDLRPQASFLDVFSIMPYHAAFGHADDAAWISRQVAWLGRYLGIEGKPGERKYIWPIVQLSDWQQPVPVEQVAGVLDHATRAPATGVTVFAWDPLSRQPAKVAALEQCYSAITG